MSERGRPQFAAETTDDGSWKRQVSAFRRWVTADGSSGFRAEPGRYHLYVSYACPWAHRTIIGRRLKDLEDVIGMTVVDPVRDERGWRFGDDTEENGQTDPVNGFRFLSEAYRATRPDFDARVTVPVLWDTETGQIVNNESAEVLRMLNSAFDEWGDATLDLYPEERRDDIDAINHFVYENVNDGVYRAGFATRQSAYERAFRALFDALDSLEQRLSAQRYLVGDRITEADWRLFTTLVRFDAVYHTHFKCNLRRIVDMPALWGYLRDLHQQPGVAETVRMDHIKRHYYVTHDSINPSGIVPLGPAIDFTTPHARG